MWGPRGGGPATLPPACHVAPHPTHPRAGHAQGLTPQTPKPCNANPGPAPPPTHTHITRAGHALGLTHSAVEDDVMSPFYVPGRVALSDNDARRIAEAYPLAPQLEAMFK